MKRKLTSAILAMTLVTSMSVPAFAAGGCTYGRGCGNRELLLQYLCRYTGWCGDSVVIKTKPQRQTIEKQETQTAPVTQQTIEKQETQTAPVTQQTTEKQETQTAPVTAANQYEQEVIRLVNAERAKYGLAALTEDAELTRTARMKSQDMHDNRYFDHNSPVYGTPFQLMKSQGIRYRTAGENIAMGYASPQAVVTAWMNSSGHRANILNASYTRIGVGYVASGHYWTQHFAG